MPIAPCDWRHGAGPALEQSCPCGSGVSFTGTKGGRYCTTAKGAKRY